MRLHPHFYSNDDSDLGNDVEPRRGEEFKTCSAGLNIIGRCNNEQCKSQESKEDLVVRKEGYGTFRLNPSTALDFDICKSKKFTAKFQATNFVVAVRKAEFRFRKEGEDALKVVTIQSGLFPEKVAVFSDEAEKVEYDFVEVKTFRFDTRLRFLV